MKFALATSLLFVYTYAEETTTDTATDAAADAAEAVADPLVRMGEKTAFTVADGWTGEYYTSCVNATNVCSFNVMSKYTLPAWGADNNYAYSGLHWAVVTKGEETNNIWGTVLTDSGKTDGSATWTGWNVIGAADDDTMKAQAASFAVETAVAATKTTEAIPVGWEWAQNAGSDVWTTTAAKTYTAVQDKGVINGTHMSQLLADDAAEDAKGMKVGDEWSTVVNSWYNWSSSGTAEGDN